MLSVESISISVGDRALIRNISFSVERGQLVALLGPNGAGKTTLLRGLAGILPTASGQISWDGLAMTQMGIRWYRHIGYSPDRSPVVSEMTVMEYLQFVSVLKEVPQAEKSIKELLEALSLGSVQNSRCGILSHGFRQRISIAQSFLSDAGIILLDEPTQGLDPEQVVRLRQYLTLAIRNRAIIMSSHHLSELAQVASHYLIMSEGVLLDCGRVTPTLESTYLESVGRTG